MGGKARQKAQYQNRDPAFPSLFASMYPALRRTAMELGYALALHGSMARDLDVIAVPWTEAAEDADTLVEALRAAVSAFIVVNHAHETNPTAKPHGRLAWSLHLVGSGTYIDLSVIPRQPLA